MSKKKGATLPCYVCYTFIHLGFHIFLNTHSDLQDIMCQNQNLEIETTSLLPTSITEDPMIRASTVEKRKT